MSGPDRSDPEDFDVLPPPATVAGRRRAAAAERDRQRAAQPPPPIRADDDWLAESDPRFRGRGGRLGGGRPPERSVPAGPPRGRGPAGRRAGLEHEEETSRRAAHEDDRRHRDDRASGAGRQEPVSRRGIFDIEAHDHLSDEWEEDVFATDDDPAAGRGRTADRAEREEDVFDTLVEGRPAYLDHLRDREDDDWDGQGRRGRQRDLDDEERPAGVRRVSAEELHRARRRQGPSTERPGRSQRPERTEPRNGRAERPGAGLRGLFGRRAPGSNRALRRDLDEVVRERERLADEARNDSAYDVEAEPSAREPAAEPSAYDAAVGRSAYDVAAEPSAYDAAAEPSADDAAAEPSADDARSARAPAGAPSHTRRIARNTAIFSMATGLSRIAGLVREIVASSYFATSGAFSAFTIAFQVPNLVRSLFADAALSAAFVPVFTELLEKGRRRDAFKLASTLFWVILIALGAITLFFIAVASFVMPLFTGDKFSAELNQLTIGLSRVLFPIVVLLGLNGLTVGILNAYDHFSVPAIAPLVWNVVIIVSLIVLRPMFHGQDQLYAYAIGVLIGTAVQFTMGLPQLRRMGFRLHFALDWRDPRIAQVFRLMLPTTIGLGIINFDLLINSSLGSLVSEQAPRAIDAAFRIYMLPQGIFSVALATVLFPALSRFAAHNDIDGLRRTMGNGIRQIFMLLIPAAAITLVLATPITRLIYQHGNFGAQSTEQVSTALFWFSFSLPFSGANLLLTRTFFSLQRPWVPTALSAVNLALNAAVSLALYKPLGIAGLVIGTAVASLGMTVLQAHFLRGHLNGRIEAAQTTLTAIKITIVSAAMGLLTYGLWWGIDHVLGRSVPAQVISVGISISAGLVAYCAAVLALRIPEALQIRGLVAGRLGR